MYGAVDATLLVLTEVSLDQRVINALESAARALGHESGVCVATLQQAGDDLVLFITEADPWAVVAIDDASVERLRTTFAPESKRLYPDTPADTSEGYRLVAVPGFASCLDDRAAKRVAWSRLKAARHPSNPLDHERPHA